MTTQNIGSVRVGSIALIAFVLLALAFSPITTQAADIGVGYDYIDTFTPAGDSGVGYDYIDTYTPGYSQSYDYIDTYTPGYSQSYDYIDTYTSYGYGGYSYSTPFYGGYSYYTPSYSYPRSSSGGSSNVYAPTNTCTAPNTCNTSYDDHSIFNAPTVVNIQNTESKSKKSTKKHYDNDYKHTYRPIAYNTPYVSLSAAPYTGLELGPVGTAIYWGFIVLWSLVAAYLIVVKRVQNKVFRSLNSFLFGDNEVAPTKVAFAGTPVAMKQTTQDDFILNQIARVRTS